MMKYTIYTYRFNRPLGGNGIFFDFNTDILYCTQFALVSLYTEKFPLNPYSTISPEMRLLHHSLRFIAIFVQDNEHYRVYNGVMLNQFKNLKKVVLFGNHMETLQNYGNGVLMTHLEGNSPSDFGE
jgi:hypothetical protein